MITNQNLNSMLKPNNTNGEFTKGKGIYSDAGIKILHGKFNHQTAMVFDIIYDHMFRMFNQLDGTSYINGSISKILKNEANKHSYFKDLLTDRKMQLYFEVRRFMSFAEDFDGSIPYDRELAKKFHSLSPGVIDEFPIEFGIFYRKELENPTDGSFDKLFELLKKYNFEAMFFKYVLDKTFYGRMPSWNNYNLNLKLNSVFPSGERTVYVLKKFFEEAKSLAFSMTYPVTCFADHSDASRVPKKIYQKWVMCGFPILEPFGLLETDKSSMSVTLPLKNKFMVFYAHDAKMCIRTFVPSKLYTLNSNAFFIGKQILNSGYYNKKSRGIKYKLNYTMSEMFEFFNLPEKDSNGNTAHRRKAIVKALKQLDGSNIIKIEKMNSEIVRLKEVWTINEEETLNSYDSSDLLEGQV